MKTTVIKEIAARVVARQNCIKSNNIEWKHKHEEALQALQEELPSGSGVDGGCQIDLDKSSQNKIVIHLGYHHMNDNGMYDGWTHHEIVVTPDLLFGVNIRITGPNRNDIKDYLHEIVSCDLLKEYDTTPVERAETTTP